MRISEFEGKRIAVWGWGREGRAALAAIRTRLPELPLAVLCTDDEAHEVRQHAAVTVQSSQAVDADTLTAFDVVVKSPGISPYQHAVIEAEARGTRFVGGTQLWFAERPDQTTLCVTGTKGKSTTTALLAHLLRAAKLRTALAGNIGMPLLELLDADAERWVIELSSYQTRDVARSGVRPSLALVTNLYPEHLDWHGGQQRYIDDKLALLTRARPQVAVLNRADPHLATLTLPDSRVEWFNHPDGWHVHEGHVRHGRTPVLPLDAVPLPGLHNAVNLCGVLAAVQASGLDAAALARHVAQFHPLPHRLQVLGVRNGVRWVNDSISTTPYASQAAFEVFAGERVVLLLGGHDRGVDWSVFAHALAAHAPYAVVTMGQNGPRIHEALRDACHASGCRLQQADDLQAAVAAGTVLLDGAGVLLLSPGAPSFGPYRDYVARGLHFAALGGFTPDAIARIPGLGIA